MGPIEHSAQNALEIKEATPADAEIIFQWRNDPVTVAMSGEQSKVDWDTHLNWFSGVLTRTDRCIFVGWLNNLPVGVCRFDINKDGTAEVSINLNPEMRGKGLSHLLLGGCLDQFKDSKADVQMILARIRPGNASSMKCFLKNGFVFQNSDDQFNYYSLELRR